MVPSFANKFDQMNAKDWLCPKIGTEINFEGTYSSSLFSTMSISLHPCSNSTDPSRPCASQEEIDLFVDNNGQWNYFSLYYVNSVINADQP